MKEIILKVLEEIACGNTGHCQINLQSESAQEMIAEKITEELSPYFKKEINKIIEDVVVGDQNNEL